MRGCWGRERFECGGAGEGRVGVCGRAVAQWRPKTAVKEKEFGGVGGREMCVGGHGEVCVWVLWVVHVCEHKVNVRVSICTYM